MGSWSIPSFVILGRRRRLSACPLSQDPDRDTTAYSSDANGPTPGTLDQRNGKSIPRVHREHGGPPQVNVAPSTAEARVTRDGENPGTARWRPPDGRRMLQLALAVVWLLDGVLQLQPFFFTPGKNGFSGMLGGMASGNPGFVARSITWNAVHRRPPQRGHQHGLCFHPDPPRVWHRLAAVSQTGPGRFDRLVIGRLVVRRRFGRCTPR